MDNDTFRQWSRTAADWGANYRKSLRDLPVRPDIVPGEIDALLGRLVPASGEEMETIFEEFEKIIVPGMTHWQHPRFFAYFPSNSAPVSVIADYLVTAMATQCMLWQTSPAATELETRVLDWMRQGLGLPGEFAGVIQDSASSATLAAVLVMRESALGWTGNRSGLAGKAQLRVYASDQVHTSIDRAIWFAGIGQENLVRVPSVGSLRSLDPDLLEQAIESDLAKGYLPAGIIASIGGTSVGGTDDITAICTVAQKYNLYVHVDAAWAGSAMICPEFRHYWKGIEGADSVVFNPHKWLGTQFDLSAHFIKDPASLTRTLAIQPEYLKTPTDGDGSYPLINYSEWSVPLGRRFRALKLWFLLRYHGLAGLQEMIRNHVKWAEDLAERIRETEGFEIVTEPMLSLFTFRYLGNQTEKPDELNLRLINAINKDGRTYLTQTKIDDKFVIRVQIGQFETSLEDIQIAYDAIVDCADRL